MPNWITNEIKVKSKDKNELYEVYQKVMGEEGFDFGKILPPENWGVKWNASDNCIAFNDGEFFNNRCCYRIMELPYGKDLDFENNQKFLSDEKYFQLSEKEFKDILNKDKEGFYFFISRFETPWGYPEPVIKEVVALFKNIEIDFKYADEDIGYNAAFGSLNNSGYTKVHQAKSQEKNPMEAYNWTVFAYFLKYSQHPAYEGYTVEDYLEEGLEDPEAYINSLEAWHKIAENVKNF